MSGCRLTIIIPFYDEVAFLGMAVRSALSQRIDGIEIVIVNDNPAQFAPRQFEPFGFGPDVRIVHHATNAGLAAARNTGLAAARGSFVGFLDADDYFMSGGLTDQLALAEQSGSDITHANCMLSAAGTPAIRPLTRETRLFGLPQHARRFVGGFETAQFFTSSWSSLYRRDFLDSQGLRFDPEQRKFEDRLFVLQTLTAAAHISSLGAPVRVWRRRAGSVSASPPSPDIHRLQLQLLEKCTGHMRGFARRPGIPERFFHREVFNSLSRLLWDLTILETAAKGDDRTYDDFGRRIARILAGDLMPARIFSDPVIRRIDRTRRHTEKGALRRADFMAAYRALRQGDLAAGADILAARRRAPIPRRRPMRSNGCHLILHLGMHKTASTYLQRIFFAEASRLRAAGVLVPVSGLMGPEFLPTRAHGFSGHLGLVHALGPGDGAVWDALEQEIAASGCRTVLLSCEGMLVPLEQTREQRLERLLDRLSSFESCQPVAFVRRPDSAAEMLYRERVCNGHRQGARTVQEFMVDFAPILTDLPRLFGPFETFAGRKTRLADYDAASAQGRLVETFAAMAGIPALNRPAPQRPDIYQTGPYPTPHRDEVLAAQLVNALIGSADLRRETLRSFFARRPHERPDDPLLCPADRLSLVDRFIAASADFAADRGYAPSYADIRAQISGDNLTSPAGLPADVVEHLLQARLMSEPAAGYAPHHTANEAGALILRLRPRPWLRRLLRRIAAPRG